MAACHFQFATLPGGLEIKVTNLASLICHSGDTRIRSCLLVCSHKKIYLHLSKSEFCSKIKITYISSITVYTCSLLSLMYHVVH